MTALQRYLRVQEGFELEIARMLAEAYFDIDPILRALEASSLIGDAVRAAQVRESQRQIRDQLRALVGGVGEQVAGYQKIASDAAVSSLYDDLSPFLRQAGLNDVQIDQMIQSQQRTAANGIETAMTRVQKSRIPLSEQVWKTGTLVNGQLDRIINSALARGSSAKEIADAVRAFVNPNTPGGVRYAASRLGRTELNNAFHASQTQAAIDNPWVLSCQWHNSESHPEPDECDELADEDRHGLGPGMFPPEEVPAKPHPQCLCYMTNETPDPDEFIDAMADKYGWDGEDILADAQNSWIDESIDSRFETSTNRWIEKDATWRSAADSLPDREAVDAWKRYGSSSDRMNAYLRSNGSDPAVAKHISDLDRFFDKAGYALESPMTVSRYIGTRRVGTDVDFNPAEAYRVGEVVRQPAYTSTTAMPMPGNGSSWMLQVRLPKDMQVVHGTSREREVILPRGTGFRTVKVDEEKMEIWIEAIPVE